MAPPVDPYSSPPSSPISVVIGPTAAFTKETSLVIDSDYESETTSTSSRSDLKSTTTSRSTVSGISLQSSLSDSRSITRSVELHPLPNSSEESPYPGFTPFDSETPTIPASVGATIADTPTLSFMVPTSQQVDPPDSQSEGADDTSERITAKTLDTLCNRVVNQITAQREEQDSSLVSTFGDSVATLQKRVQDLLQSMDDVEGRLLRSEKARDEERKDFERRMTAAAEEFERRTTAAAEEYERLTTAAAEEYERLTTAAAEKHAREKDAMSKQHSADFAKLAEALDQYKAQYDRDQAKAAKEKTEVAEEYARYKETTVKEKADAASEYAKYKETAAAERLATSEQYARDMAAIEDTRLQEKERHESEFSFISKEVDTVKACLCSLEKKALMAIHCRTVSNDAMRSLCGTLKLPTYKGGTNGPVVFREWLDEAVSKVRATMLTRTGDPQTDDSIRKEALKESLKKKLKGFHSGQPYFAKALQEQAPALSALRNLYECDEALDVLTQRNHIILEEGNYAAHHLNLDSLGQFSLQLDLPDSRLHMMDVSVKAMQVLIQLCEAYSNQFRPELPPSRSTLWTSANMPSSTSSSLPLASPPATTPTATTPTAITPTATTPTATTPTATIPTATTPPASTPLAPGPPASASSSHPQAQVSRSRGSGFAKRGSRSNKGR